MASPRCLKLYNKADLRHQKFIEIALTSSDHCCRAVIESTSSIIGHLKALDLGRLAVHVELGMLAVLAHAVSAVGLAVAHFLKFK